MALQAEEVLELPDQPLDDLPLPGYPSRNSNAFGRSAAEENLPERGTGLIRRTRRAAQKHAHQNNASHVYQTED